MAQGRTAPVSALPALKPIVVVSEDDVDAVLRSARAELARLSLDLRALQHEATALRSSVSAGTVSDRLNLPAAQELLRTGLAERLALRRAELLVEVEMAQAAAARHVAAAQMEAASLVAAGRQELLQVLSDVTRLPEPPTRDDAGVTSVVPPRPERAPLDSPLPAPPVPVPDPVPAPPAPVVTPLAVIARVPEPGLQAQPKDQGRARPPRNGLLHADVLMPLLAVAIVLVVLVAWLA